MLASLGKSSDDESADADSPSMLDTISRQVSESLTKWRDSAAFRRFLGVPVGRDQVVALGGTAWLEARVGPIVQMGAAAVRFVVDGEAAGTCSLSDDTPSGIEHTMLQPGLLPLELEPLSRLGVALGPAGVVGSSFIHVMRDEPVFAIDAALVLERDAPALGLLRRLADADLQLFYFDLATEERGEAIRAVLTAEGLPRAAVLTHPTVGEDLDPGTTDFSRVFALTAIRRLHASGVPVMAVITRRDDDGRDGTPVVFEPEAVDTDAIADAHRRAEIFLAGRAETDPLTWRLDQATNTRLVAGNALIVEFDNRRARERLFELVEGARSSIHVQTYMFDDSRVAEALVVRLVQKARAGIRVRVIIDALYSGEQALGRRNLLVESLKLEPNAEVVVGSPIEFSRSLDSIALKKRDHRKLVLIDDAIGIVSGRNIGDAYYRGFDETPIHQHTHHGHIPWLDAHVEATGPIVDEIRTSFTRAWTEYGGAEADLPTGEASGPTGSCTARFVVHNGLVDANAMLQYEAMLHAARDHIYIVNDFPIVTSLASAMQRALSRGVRLHLLTGNAVARRADGTFFPGPVYRELFDHMVKQRLEPLIRSGARVYEFVAPAHPMIVPRGGEVRPYVHAKVMTCDGTVASIGSANLDATASYWEHEANLVVQDEGFARTVESQIEEMIGRAHEIDLESTYWKRDRSKRTIVSKLWPTIVYS